MIVKGITSTNFEFSIDDEILDDFEFFESMAAAEKGNLNAFFDAYNRALGEEEFKALKEHCRDEKGKVSAVKVRDEFNEIISQLSSGKN